MRARPEAGAKVDIRSINRAGAAGDGRARSASRPWRIGDPNAEHVRPDSGRGLGAGGRAGFAVHLLPCGVPASPAKAPLLDRTIRRAVDAFEAAFGPICARDAVAWAPGRVNLIGDHTDYAGGLALPAAIQLGCVAVFALRGEAETLGVVSADLPGRDAPHADDAPPGSLPGPCGPRSHRGGVARGADSASLRDALAARELPEFAAYTLGPAVLVAEHLGARGFSGRVGMGMRVAIASDVPIGSGLSSSAAVEVACAVAAAAVLERAGADRHAGKLDACANDGRPCGIDSELPLARLCQRAEHDFARAPCGLLDQLTAVHGMPGHALRIDFGDPALGDDAAPDPSSLIGVAIPDRARFVVFDSGVGHRNADGAYARVRGAAERAAGVLGRPLGTHRDASAHAAVLGRLSPGGVPVARHVLTETARVDDFIAALRADELLAAGRIMLDSHASLRDQAAVSCPELDQLVEACVSSGAFGARLTGAGFGGCVVALYLAATCEASSAVAAARYLAATGRGTLPMIVEPGGGARVIRRPIS